MALARSGYLLLYLFYLFNPICADYEVPMVIIQALVPKGLRIILPDDPEITAFYFEAVVYRPNESTFHEDFVDRKVKGFGTKQARGWVFEEPDIEMKQNQYIQYKVFVSKEFGTIGKKEEDGSSNFVLRGYSSPKRTHLIYSFVDPLAHGPLCPESITKVRGKRVCAGQTIFEDNFDTFREDNWQISHYIPIDHPEHPFVSYQRLQSNPTVRVANGTLKISPQLQQDIFTNSNQSITSGTLDLTSGCTELRICSMSSIGVDIIPPVVSGRVTSARFAFTYGTVTVRAKMPQGDWLYPEILLEPLSKKYGSLNYASGVLKVAMVRGNTDARDERYSNKWLTGGPILNSRCRGALEFYHSKSPDDEFWGDGFHDYTLKWSPEQIVLEVDGVEYGRFKPGSTGLRSWLPSSCRGDWYELLNNGGIMAPFDDHFYLTLGVAVGGIIEFPDGMTNLDQHPKPWRNRGRKAAFSFWQDKDNWKPTWTQPELLIDSIKVVAL